MNVAVDSNLVYSPRSPEKFKGVEEKMHSGVEDGVFPGAVLLVGQGDDVLYSRAFGYRSARSKTGESIPMKLDTVFDVASLTNILVTATTIFRLIEDGRVTLDDKVCRYIEGFSVHGKSPVSIAHLLSHSSGLPHWVPFFEELLKANSGARMGIMTSRGARDYILTQIRRMPLKFAPGTKQIYSDLDFILLGFLIEFLTGSSLERAASQYVFQPLGLKSTSYIDLSMIRRRGIHPVIDLISPTEDCAWRKRILCGEVHDDNAWAMGGIAGHSGVFSTAGDLHRFAAEMLRAYRGQSNFLSQESVQTLWQGVDNKEEPSYQFGWDTPSKENGMDESGLSQSAVGQCGFTGCSLWIEPDKNIYIVLMSNRVHPTRANKKIRNFRPEIHSAVLDALTKL